MRKVLLIDLDDTLLNTQDLKLRIFERLKNEGIKDCSKFYVRSKEIVGPHSRWEVFAQELESECKISKKKIFKIIHQEVKKIKINESILNFLKKFKGKKIIFSLGDEAFQMEKIKSSRLEKFVDKILITKGDKALFLKQFIKGKKVLFDDKEYCDITLLDDRVEFLDEIKKTYPWIKTLHVSDIIN